MREYKNLWLLGLIGMKLGVAIYYNKTCFGLAQDAKILEKLVRGCGATSIQHLDVNEPAVAVDVAFHLETPVYQVIGYAHTNILMINAEQWIKTSYDPYLVAFDRVFVRSKDDCERFQKELRELGGPWEKVCTVPWSLGNFELKEEKGHPVIGEYIDDKIGFVCFIGKNEYKYEWIHDFLQGGGWEGTFPALRIYTSNNDYAEKLRNVIVSSPNIQIECRDLDSAEIGRLQWLYAGHLLCSRGEGFGYAAAEAEARGAKLLLSDLPVFKEYYDGRPNVKWLPSRLVGDSDRVAPKARSGLRYALTGPSLLELDRMCIREAVQAIVNSPGLSANERLTTGKRVAEDRWRVTVAEFEKQIWEYVKTYVSKRRPVSGNWHAPPVLVPNDCPLITIVTPTRNRRKLIDITFHNLLSTDYPLEKITWVVVENSDDIEKASSDKIMNFQINCRAIRIKYIPLPGVGRKSIGELRNIGVEHSETDLIVFMDDDDHYPVTSIRRRVAWLLRGLDGNIAGRKTRIVGCTTLALYDLKRGISAVNVPPWDLPLSHRISEATLAFHKSAWLDREFCDTGVAEGEKWISGREGEFLEIPPQQIIVAFSHGENSTSRRVPALKEPNGCFWGFPPAYLKFVHGLVGVEVEEERRNGLVGGGATARERLRARVAERTTQ